MLHEIMKTFCSCNNKQKADVRFGHATNWFSLWLNVSYVRCRLVPEAEISVTQQAMYLNPLYGRGDFALQEEIFVRHGT